MSQSELTMIGKTIGKMWNCAFLESVDEVIMLSMTSTTHINISHDTIASEAIDSNEETCSALESHVSELRVRHLTSPGSGSSSNLVRDVLSGERWKIVIEWKIFDFVIP